MEPSDLSDLAAPLPSSPAALPSSPAVGKHVFFSNLSDNPFKVERFCSKFSVFVTCRLQAKGGGVFYNRLRTEPMYHNFISGALAKFLIANWLFFFVMVAHGRKVQ